jgi:hypothetical protein
MGSSRKALPLSSSYSALSAEKLSKRRERILKYKSKIYERRNKKGPICKKFNGRSKIACNKLRVNGKFVKASTIAHS